MVQRDIRIRAEIEDQLSKALSNMSRDLSYVVSMMSQVNSSAVKSATSLSALNKVLDSGEKHSNTYARSVDRLSQSHLVLGGHFYKTANAARDLQKQLQATGRTQDQASQRMITMMQRQLSIQKGVKQNVYLNNLRQEARSLTELSNRYANASRRVTLALTVPIFGFMQESFRNYRILETETVRTTKLLSDSYSDVGAAIEELGKRLDKITQKYGLARELAQSLAGDYAELGISSTQTLADLVDLTAAIEKLGNVDISQSQEFLKSVYQNVLRIKRDRGELIKTEEDYAEVIAEVRGQLAMFNLVENKTSLSLKEIAKGFPELTAAATTFGLSMTEATSLLIPMVSAGFQLGASANSVKVSLQRLISLTKQNDEMITSLRGSYKGFNVEAEIGIEGIQQLADSFNAMRKGELGAKGTLDFFARLFGVRQGPRMEVAIQNLAQFQDQLDTLGTVENDLAKKLEGFVKERAAGLGEKYNNIQIKKFQDLSKVVTLSGDKDQKIADAFTAARGDLANYLKEQAVRGADEIGKIQTESGRAMLIALAGGGEGSEAARKFEQEIALSLETSQVQYQRFRESIKAIGRAIVPILANILKYIVPIIQKISEFIQKIPEGVKAMVAIFAVLVAAIGPVLALRAAFVQLRQGLLSLRAANPFGKLKMDTIEIGEDILKTSDIFFKFRNQIVQMGNRFYFKGTRKELLELQKLANLQFSGRGETLKALRLERRLGIKKEADYSGISDAQRIAFGDLSLTGGKTALPISELQIFIKNLQTSLDPTKGTKLGRSIGQNIVDVLETFDFDKNQINLTNAIKQNTTAVNNNTTARRVGGGGPTGPTGPSGPTGGGPTGPTGPAGSGGPSGGGSSGGKGGGTATTTPTSTLSSAIALSVINPINNVENKIAEAKLEALQIQSQADFLGINAKQQIKNLGTSTIEATKKVTTEPIEDVKKEIKQATKRGKKKSEKALVNEWLSKTPSIRTIIDALLPTSPLRAPSVPKKTTKALEETTISALGKEITYLIETDSDASARRVKEIEEYNAQVQEIRRAKERQELERRRNLMRVSYAPRSPSARIAEEPKLDVKPSGFIGSIAEFPESIKATFEQIKPGLEQYSSTFDQMLQNVVNVKKLSIDEVIQQLQLPQAKGQTFTVTKKSFLELVSLLGIKLPTAIDQMTDFSINVKRNTIGQLIDNLTETVVAGDKFGTISGKEVLRFELELNRMIMNGTENLKTATLKSVTKRAKDEISKALNEGISKITGFAGGRRGGSSIDYTEVTVEDMIREVGRIRRGRRKKSLPVLPFNPQTKEDIDPTQSTKSDMATLNAIWRDRIPGDMAVDEDLRIRVTRMGEAGRRRESMSAEAYRKFISKGLFRFAKGGRKPLDKLTDEEYKVFYKKRKAGIDAAKRKIKEIKQKEAQEVKTNEKEFEKISQELQQQEVLQSNRPSKTRTAQIYAGTAEIEAKKAAEEVRNLLKKRKEEVSDLPKRTQERSIASAAATIKTTALRAASENYIKTQNELKKEITKLENGIIKSDPIKAAEQQERIDALKNRLLESENIYEKVKDAINKEVSSILAPKPQTKGRGGGGGITTSILSPFQEMASGIRMGPKMPRIGGLGNAFMSTGDIPSGVQSIIKLIGDNLKIPSDVLEGVIQELKKPVKGSDKPKKIWTILEKLTTEVNGDIEGLIKILQDTAKTTDMSVESMYRIIMDARNKIYALIQDSKPISASITSAVKPTKDQIKENQDLLVKNIIDDMKSTGSITSEFLKLTDRPLRKLAEQLNKILQLSGKDFKIDTKTKVEDRKNQILTALDMLGVKVNESIKMNVVTPIEKMTDSASGVAESVKVEATNGGKKINSAGKKLANSVEDMLSQSANKLNDSSNIIDQTKARVLQNIAISQNVRQARQKASGNALIAPQNIAPQNIATQNIATQNRILIDLAKNLGLVVIESNKFIMSMVPFGKTTIRVTGFLLRMTKTLYGLARGSDDAKRQLNAFNNSLKGIPVATLMMFSKAYKSFKSSFTGTLTMGVSQGINQLSYQFGTLGIIGGNVLENIARGIARIPVVGGPALLIITAISGGIALIAKTSDEWGKKSQFALNNFKESFKNIKDAFKTLISPIEDFFASVVFGGKKSGDAVSGAKNKLESFSSTFLKLSQKFKIFFEKIVAPGLRKFLEIIAFVVNSIKPVYSALFNLFSSMAKKAAGPVKKELVSITSSWDKLGDKGSAAAMRIANSIDQVTYSTINMSKKTSLWDGLSDKGSAAARRIADDNIKSVDSISTAWSLLMDQLFAFGKDLLDVWRYVFGAIQIELIKFAAGFFVDFLAALVSAAATAGNKISKFLVPNVPGLDKAIDWFTGKVSDKAPEVAESLSGLINEALGSFGKGIKPEDLEKKLEEIMKKGSGAGLGKTLANLFKNAFKDPSVSRGAGKSVKDVMKNAGKEAQKELKKSFYNAVISGLSDAIGKAKDDLTKILEKQKEDALKIYDDQIEAINALAEAEARLTEAQEYEQERRRRIRDRAYESETYQRDRELAVYQGRIEDVRRLDREELRNKQQFEDDIAQLDDNRLNALRAQNREDAIAAIKAARDAAEKELDAILERWQKFLDGIKEGNITSQADFEKFFNDLTTEASKFGNELNTVIQNSFGNLPSIINSALSPSSISAGFFKLPIDQLIADAKVRFGLETGTGQNAESILGITQQMLSNMSMNISDAFKSGGAIQTSYNTGVNQLVAFIGTASAQIAQAWKDAIANANADILANYIKEMAGPIDQIAEYISKVLSDAALKGKLPTTSPTPIQGAPRSGSGSLPVGGGGGRQYAYRMGGLIRQYAYGGLTYYGLGGQTMGSVNTTIPAILHGGEFVLRKSAVDKYGLDMLKMINQGIYVPKPPRFRIPESNIPRFNPINERSSISKTESTQNYNFYVDNFIGETEWFNSMMKEYNIKVVPTNQKQAGLENRVISTYNGINRGL